MSIIGSNIIAGSSGQGAGVTPYQIDRSLRFNSADSAYLNRTPSSAGNRRTWTWSGWVKRTSFGTRQQIFGALTSGSVYGTFEFNTDDTLWFLDNTLGTSNIVFQTTRVFRDPSAWYHFVVALDSTAGTNAERIKLYVNGVQETGFSTGPAVASNGQGLTNSTVGHNIGSWAPLLTTLNLNAYLAEIHFVDGQQLAATDFGEYDNNNNVWQPKAYSGTYGTNGFKLNFSDNTSTTTISQDSSGNNNDWTANNISVSSGSGNDSLLDSPTNYDDGTNVGGNYATLNPLDGSPAGLSNGNLDATSANAYPTIIPGSGQWYYEVNGTGYTWDGTRGNFTPRAGSHNFGQRPFSGTPATGHVSLCTTNLPDPTIADGSTVMDVVLWTGDGSSSRDITGLNFSPDLVWTKNRTTAYWHNLYDVIRGSRTPLHSNTTNGDDTSNDALYGGVSSFNNDGFSLAAGSNTPIWVNALNSTYVGWTWDAGTSTVSNTDGSITSSVRANTSAGFSIVTWTASTQTAATVGHGLNKQPELIIAKSRTASHNWYVFHPSLDTVNVISQTLYLNTTAAKTNITGIWGDWSEMTSSTFGIYDTAGSYTNNGNMVAYCFTSVEGYSKFGTYEGNGLTDGSFVFTGFRPRWVMVKNTSSAGNWTINDAARDPFNVSDTRLWANLTSAEGTSANYYIDFLSNGFKLRTSTADTNTSGNTYIYAAFAEHPFKTARAR